MEVNMGFPSGGEANQGWKLYLTSLIMILSAGLVVIARIVIRFRAAKLGADDYTIVVSLAFSIYLSVTIQLAVVHGYGKHVRDLSKEELHTCLKFFWLAQTPYKIVVCLNKTSVILFYIRIFISRNFRWLCYIALAIVIGSGIATMFATIFQCVPLEKSWNKSVEGTCIDSSNFWLANAVLNISTDVIVLALPIHEIFKLQLKLQEKILLYGVFLIGGFVTITSILRVTAVANSVRNQQDQTWNFISRGIWTLVEANLGIICASLIVLRQLVMRLILSKSRAVKPGPIGGYEYGYGGIAGKRNTKRDAPILTNFDDTVDNEDRHMGDYVNGRRTSGEGVWASDKSYQLTSISHGAASDDGRKSDEKYIMSARGIERDDSQSSVESMNILTGWPLDQPMSITKKVGVQVNVRPVSE